MHSFVRSSFALAVLVIFTACGGSSSQQSPDAGVVIPSTPVTPTDAGIQPDAGTDTPDSGTEPQPDAGTVPDGGTNTVSQPGAPMLFRTLEPMMLVDTRNAAGSLCGPFTAVQGTQRKLVIDLDDCAIGSAIPADATGIIGSITLDTASTETFEVRLQGSDAIEPGPANTVGPLQSSTHGFVTMLGANRAFTVEVSGTSNVEVLIQLSGALVPQASGGQYVHLLQQPLRWFASNPNDDGFRDVWPRLDSTLRYPVVGAEQGATGMLGAVHLGPGVWRDERVWFHMGPNDPSASTHSLPRWSSVPVDGHFPWRYSSFFFTDADASQLVEMRASAVQFPEDTGIEPWVDAVGFLSPNAGLVYRPLDRAKVFPVSIHQNDSDVSYDTGFTSAAGVEGVTGTLTFDLPHFPFDEQNRWFFVMVGKDADTFGGTLGGGLEGPDWMTAGLNQNGRVTVRFITKTDVNGRFVMRHYSYVAGGPSPGAQYFDVTVNVRIDGVLARP